MAASKLSLILALNLVLFSVVHAVPTPSIAPMPSSTHCPVDALKFRVCANVLNLIKLKIGVPKNEGCCPLIKGLTDVDAAVCLCTAIKANVLGINLDVPVDLSTLLNFCGKSHPSNYICPV